MQIKTVVVGMLQTNCYLLGDETQKVCALIDPGTAVDRILEAAESEGWRVTHILLTHGHFDHILAVSEIQKRTGAQLYISRKDEWLLDPAVARHAAYVREPYTMPRVDGYLSEGMTLQVGSLTISVLETPGHTAGSVCLLCGNRMFSGDTLFCEDCGRTDLDTGSQEDMLRSLKKLALLPDDYSVYPGHEEATTLSHERAANYMMRESLRQ
ncbi:MAG: MBL fold metallo-hydrolase [Clostridiaceae bacterium]|nr:MBL fold metallo-hydrolase [Clostridiaceae bacterium]